MAAKQVIVKKTTVKKVRAFSPGTSSKNKGKGQKRCPGCGKYM